MEVSQPEGLQLTESPCGYLSLLSAPRAVVWCHDPDEQERQLIMEASSIQMSAAWQVC